MRGWLPAFSLTEDGISNNIRAGHTTTMPMWVRDNDSWPPLNHEKADAEPRRYVRLDPWATNYKGVLSRKRSGAAEQMAAAERRSAPSVEP